MNQPSELRFEVPVLHCKAELFLRGVKAGRSWGENMEDHGGEIIHQDVEHCFVLFSDTTIFSMKRTGPRDAVMFTVVDKDDVFRFINSFSHSLKEAHKHVPHHTH